MEWDSRSYKEGAHEEVRVIFVLQLVNFPPSSMSLFNWEGCITGHQ